MNANFLYEMLSEHQTDFDDFRFAEGSITRTMGVWCPRIEDENTSLPSTAQRELEELDFDGTVIIETEKPSSPIVLNGSVLYFFDTDFHLQPFLHELLHCEIELLEQLPRYYQDALIVALTAYLTPKVAALPSYLRDCLSLPEQEARRTCYGEGFDDPVERQLASRPQGLLFLLKSIELDLRNGWALGTVWSRGNSDFDHLFIPSEDEEI